MTARPPLDEAAMRELWERHPELSAAAIGERFGVSRNVVIGMANRRKWAPRGERFDNPGPSLAERLDRLNIFPPASRCVFPLGHPGDAAFRFCCDPGALPGAPYCHQHMRIAHVSEARFAALRRAWDGNDERRAAAARVARKTFGREAAE